MFRKYLLLITALLYSFTFIFWTDVPNDMFYWINSSYFYEENKMCILSMTLINLLTSFSCHEIFLIKFYSWLISIVSVLIPYFFLVSKEKWLEHINWLSVSFFLLGYGTWQILSPDTFTMLAMSILCTFIIKSELRNYRSIIICSFISAISIACRLPNIICVFFCLIFLFQNEYITQKEYKSATKKSIIYISALLLFLYIIYSAIYKDLNVFGVYTSIPSRADDDHSIISLLKCYHITFMIAIIPISVGFMLISISNYINKYISNYYLQVCCGVCFFYIMLRTFLRLEESPDTEISFILFGLMLYRCFETNDTVRLRNTLLIIGITLSACAGSNNAFIKCHPTICCFAPLILIDNKLLFNNNLRKIMLFMSVCVLSFTYFIGIKDFRIISGIMSERFLLVNKEYYNKQLCEKSLYNKYGNKNNTIFIGSSCIFSNYWINDTKPLFNQTYHQHININNEVNNVIDIAKKNSKTVIFSYRNDISEKLRKELTPKGYEIISPNEQCNIFKRK